MAISAGLAILVPIVAIIFMAVRKKLNWKATLFGALLFFTFALLLEQLMHYFVIGQDPTKSALYQNITLYALYGGFAAGIFEETARLLGFKFLIRISENEPIETGISYGLGHGGIEAILIGGISAISNLVLSAMVNSGAIRGIAGAMKGDQLNTFNQQMHALASTPSYIFLISGFERVSALILQIGLSLFVFKAVVEKKWKYFIYAILIHAGVDIFAVLFQRGVVKNMILMESAVFVASVAVMLIALKMNKRALKPQETDKPALD
jgi:uncharacterized membrane protein YhfC